MIEVRYAGAVVGRSAVVRDVDPQGLFLGVTEPMPVGTELVLEVGHDTVPGKVAAVSESQEVARAGMRVQFLDPNAAALFGIAVDAIATAAPPRVSTVAAVPTTVAAVPTASAAVPTAVAAVPTASAAVPTVVTAVPTASAAVPTVAAASGAAASMAAEVEAEAGAPSLARGSTASGDQLSAPDDPETSGPVASGDGGAGAGGSGGGQGGGNRKNRRNRRR